MTRSTPATPLSRRRTLLGAALLASAALGLLTACGSGQITQTDTQVPAVPGVSGDSTDGQIALRNGVVAYADLYKPGSTVPISVHLFNNSKQAVKLSGVKSDSGAFVLAGGAQASAAAAKAAPPSPTATSASATPSGTKKPSGSPSASASAVAETPTSAAPAPTSAGSSNISVPIAVGGVAALSKESGTYLAIDQLTGPPLASGGALKNVVFTFTYADGSTTTITLPELPMTPPLTPLPKPSSVVHNEQE